MPEAVDSKANIRQQAARGAVATLIGQAARFLIQLAGIIALSRILGPTAVGLFATLAVIVGLGELLRDFGLSSAVIQAENVTKSQSTNLFWVNTCLGLGLAAVCAAFAPLVAKFYGEAQLTMACVAIGSVFAFGGIGTQFRAQLSRNLKFTTIAVIDVISPLVGLVAGVAVALANGGFWALVVQQITVSLVAMVLVVIASSWVPGLPVRGVEMRALITFGWNVGCTQLVNFVSKNLDTVVIGRFFGAEQLGLYNRAYQLLTVPLTQLSTPATKVAFPVLSRLRGDPERYVKYLLSGQQSLLHVVLFFFTYTIAVAPQMIEIALGSEWSGVVPIYQILAVSGLVQTASYATYWVFLSEGLTGSSLRFTLLSRSCLIACVLIGSMWGVTGVAAGYTIAIVVAWPCGLWWLKRASASAPVGLMGSNAIRIFVIYVVAGVCAYGVSRVVLGTWVTIGVSLIVYLAFLGCAVAAVPSFRSDLRTIYSFRTMVRV
ncbi:lipopolysaccharide biosynthesis protein [Gordonia amicalis]|uniref:Lipopolysaccharide biosynthesis protein n=1 Tax=Gordonia amicalis TaxID=89053 RepID=A0AAE4U1X0_9ACTN|nr:lipopolysaccharide biosynthesis protein [Gordonia amicalis]MDV6314524.1 lipopolysaccharide biosynthesis protein [Gordonia amicalis]UPW13458.1 lipopolysaccharide biosynthesis protein [Gordonia amicalis]